MQEVENFILEQRTELRELLIYLHAFITDKFKLRSKLNYNLPFYYGKSWICYIRPLKKGGAELSFIKGHLLEDWQGVLEKRDRKMVRSLVLQDIESVDEKVLKAILKSAIQLDQSED